MDSNNKQTKNRFYLFVIFLLIMIMALRLPMDTDFWWHVQVGKDSVLQKSLILTDQYSYTKNGAPWDNHSWLAQILFYFVYNRFSIQGIMVLVLLIAVLGIFFIFKTMRGPTLWKGFLLILTVLISAVIWSPRPQIFSFLFLAIEQFLLFEYEKNQNKKLLISLLGLFVIWSNLHGGFSLGVIYIITWFIGIIFDDLFLSSAKTPEKPKYKKSFILVFIFLVFILVMINPNGINVWLVQFKTVSISSLQNLIPEWSSPNFHELYQQPFLWAWLIIVFFGLFSKNDLSGRRIIPLIIFGYLAFLSRRNYGPFAIVGTPIISELGLVFFNQKVQNSQIFQYFFVKFNKSNQKNFPKINSMVNLTIVALLFLSLLTKFVYLANPNVVDFYEKQMFPKEAVNWLSENHLSGNGLNEYAWGGYILWYLPDVKVFVDGRTDLFGDEIILDWLSMISGDQNFEKLLDEYNIDWVFIEQGRPLVSELERTNWIVLYEDHQSVILKAP